MVADSIFRTFYTLPLNNPYIQFLLQAQGGSIEMAMNLYVNIVRYARLTPCRSRVIDHKYHPHMARFLQARGFSEETLQLQGCPGELKVITCK